MTYEMKKSTVLRNTLIAVVIAAVLGFLVFYLAAPTPKSSPLDKDNIVAISQQAVEAKIKNTASATFPWGWISGTGGLDTTENGDYQVKDLGNNKFEVDGKVAYLDSKGKAVTSNFTVNVSFDSSLRNTTTKVTLE